MHIIIINPFGFDLRVERKKHIYKKVQYISHFDSFYFNSVTFSVSEKSSSSSKDPGLRELRWQTVTIKVRVMLCARWTLFLNDTLRLLRGQVLWHEWQLVLFKRIKRSAWCYLLSLSLTWKRELCANMGRVKDSWRGGEKKMHICKQSPAIAMVLKAPTCCHMMVITWRRGCRKISW